MTGRDAAEIILTMVLNRERSYSRDAVTLRHNGFPNIADGYESYAEAAQFIASQIQSDLMNGKFD